jgi:M6 family metalloprotease-like protein
MVKISLCIVIILYFTVAISQGAPPNPKLFFHQSEDGKLVPKMSITETDATQMLDPDEIRADYAQQPDGIEYVLAIRIDFSDQSGEKPASAFNDALFGKKGTSMYLYFNEVSYGQMQVLPGYLGGVVPDGDRWYRAKNKMSYYGAGKIDTDRYRQLVEEACVSADAEVDFSKYDRDNDGYVDHLMIIHSGNDEASTGVSNDIWSAAVKSIQGVYDGKRIMSAIIVAEDPSENRLNIGIFCHEFFHEFGAPDIYEFSWNYPAGYWCLMGMFGPYLDDGQHPSHICSYLKWDFDADKSNGIHGWINPIDLVDQGTYSIDSFELPDGNRSYKIDIPGKNGMEYFLIENRNKRAGTIYDTYQPDSGIVIWHIDETQPPYYSNPSRAWVEDPNDPNHESSRQATSDAAFSANDNQTSFTPVTDPNSNANDGSSSGIIISDISSEGLSMTFNLFFGDSYEPNDSIAQAFGPLEFGKQYTSFIKDKNDIDYYMIQIESSSLIAVYLENIQEGYKYNLVVYDSQGNAIPTNEEISQIAKRVSFKTNKNRKYYISVSSNTAYKSNQSYSLIVSSTSTGLAPEMINITKIYPNPGPDSNGRIFFEYSLLAPIDKLTLTLYSLNGMSVYSHSNEVVTPNDKISLDINNIGLASGVYIYVITTEFEGKTGVKIGKIAILH